MRRLGCRPSRSGWRVVYTVEAHRLLVLMIGGRGDVYERVRRWLG